MKIPSLIPGMAWLPVTPRGVAAFAAARGSRLWLVQCLVALLAAGVFGWFLRSAWAPVVRAAIVQLPDDAALTNGVLRWPGAAPVVLADGHFLCIAVDPRHSGTVNSMAHLELEFGEAGWQATSFLGVLDLPGLMETTYPASVAIALKRDAVEPWWGAREPYLIAIAMAGVAAGLMVSWTLLASLYCVPVWLTGFFANRNLGWGGSWRLAGAALMPGALLMSLALVLYGLRIFGLMQLLLAFGLHFLVGWIYLFVSPLFLPRNPSVPPARGNPFLPAK